VSVPSCRVASGAGFAGDRFEPAVEFARSGAVDAIVLECLAERTLIGGLINRRAGSGRGFDKRLRARLGPLLPASVAARIPVITNLGAADPAAAGHEARALCAELGLPDARIAVVHGDDVVDRTGRVEWDGGTAFAPEDLLGAHAYLGSGEITAAVAGGADLVLTGRVADSALFAAAARARLGLEDSAQALAPATVGGHLLECAGQLTGGNLATTDRPPLTPREMAELGYPVMTVGADGELELGVQPGRPGRLDATSCTLQLLYEVHDPAAYLTPDAVLDFTDVAFEQLAPDRVRVTGVRSPGRPARLKVVAFSIGSSVIADVEVGYAGSGALDRARAACDVLAARLDRLGIADRLVDVVGVDSLLGAASRGAGAPAEVRVHVSARCTTLDQADRVEDEAYTLTIAGPAGGAGMRSERRPDIRTVSGLIDRAALDTGVEWIR